MLVLAHPGLHLLVRAASLLDSANYGDYLQQRNQSTLWLALFRCRGPLFNICMVFSPFHCGTPHGSLS